MAAGAPPSERPTLLSAEPWDAASELGSWLAPTSPPAEDELLGRAAAVARRGLADAAAALGLLPARERRRAELLFVWTRALLRTAAEPDAPATRVARIHRAAFHLARALAGEPAESAFLRLLAAESARRTFGRAALDGLLAAAREWAEAPRAATPEADAERWQALAHALAAALAGAEPAPATVDLAAGLGRLGRLLALPEELAQRRCGLALSVLPEPLQYRREDEIVAAVVAEAEALRPLLLRGARAAAEVPLTFRRPLVYLLPIALELLGAIEERPRELLRRAPRLSFWSRRRSYWRARFTPLG